MLDATIQAGAPRLDAQGHLCENLACVACGYNLRGLEPQGGCPECGESIARTLASPSLVNSDPRWLARVETGLWLLLGAVVLGATSRLLVLSVDLYRHAGSAVVVLGAIHATGLLVALAGCWLVTMPEQPARFQEDRRLGRRLLRWGAGGGLALLFVYDLGVRLCIGAYALQPGFLWLGRGRAMRGALETLVVALVAVAWPLYAMALARRMRAPGLAYASAVSGLLLVLVAAATVTLWVGGGPMSGGLWQWRYGGELRHLENELFNTFRGARPLRAGIFLLLHFTPELAAAMLAGVVAVLATRLRRIRRERF